MIAEIINGITQELLYFVKDNEGMVILDTNLQEDMSFSFPLIIIRTNGSPESARLPGNGLTRIDWSLIFDVYTQEPDAYINDDTTGSTSHLSFSDLIRNHLESENWKTQLMVNLTANYGFRMTYSGTSQAPQLQTDDKTYLGYSHNFETIGFDSTIAYTQDMTDDTQTVVGEVEFE